MNTIYVFCNSCSYKWHSATALSDEGLFLAGHICSDHCFIRHDMGVDDNGWKREVYRAAYPDGFTVEYVERDAIKGHAGVQAAHAAHLAYGEDAYNARMKAITDVAGDQQPRVEIEMSDGTRIVMT